MGISEFVMPEGKMLCVVLRNGHFENNVVHKK